MYICIYIYTIPVASFDGAGVPLPHGMGLTMEGRGPTLVVPVSYCRFYESPKWYVPFVCYIVFPTIWPPAVSRAGAHMRII